MYGFPVPSYESDNAVYKKKHPKTKGFYICKGFLWPQKNQENPCEHGAVYARAFDYAFWLDSARNLSWIAPKIERLHAILVTVTSTTPYTSVL